MTLNSLRKPESLNNGSLGETVLNYKTCSHCAVFQKLIRMNMPVSADKTVHFSTTLFALIRESLDIRMGPGMYEKLFSAVASMLYQRLIVSWNRIIFICFLVYSAVAMALRVSV